jgi:hypothetical protein
VSENPTPQATQLRMAFAPSPPDRISLDISGLTLLVSANVPEPELFSFLVSKGLDPEYRPGLGVSAPARLLTRFADLGVDIVVSEALTPVWTLVCNPPESAFPATVERSSTGYVLSWESKDGLAYDEIVPPVLAPLLGFADLTLVATDDVWADIEKNLPTLGPSGTVSLSAEGFVSITTSKPQILEASKIPGLFRISPTKFGVCSAFTEDLLREPGLRWSTPRPVRKSPAIEFPAHLSLAPHVRNSLPQLVGDLSTLGAKAVVWESGLGRRILVLAALEVLDAYPATVLCPPQSLWLWMRHVDMVNRTCGLTHEHSDVQLITYHDLPRRRVEAQSVIFDDLASPEALTAWSALLRLQYLTDAYRIAVEDAWPEDLEESRRLMEVLRPGEFRSDISIAERYPVDPSRRLYEHVEVYLSRRTREDTVDRRVFRRSSVRVVATTSAQQAAIATASSRITSTAPQRVLLEVLELLSAGPSTSLSPKIGAAVELVRTAVSRGRSVAVLARHKRSAQLLRSLLRPMSVSIVDGAPSTVELPREQAVVVVFDTALPRLQAFDDVIVVDYPWTFKILESSVSPASYSEGPDVVVIHAAGSPDDRLAVLAARRSEYGPLSAEVHQLNTDDIAYVLAPRH